MALMKSVVSLLLTFARRKTLWLYVVVDGKGKGSSRS